MAQDQRRLVDILDDIGNGESLSGTGYPQQCLCRRSREHALGELCNRFRLVARRLVV